MKGAFNDRLSESSKRSGSRVVLALDFSGPHAGRLRAAEKVLTATKKEIAAVKMNHHLLLPFGLEGVRGLVRVCRRAGLPLIADLKVNDIESTNMNIADSLLAYGFDCFIANPFVGKEEGLGPVIERVHEKGGGVVLLVYMSHKGADEGYGLVTDSGKPLYRIFAERARDWGADGVVVSSKSPERIAEARKIVGKGCMIFSPGVGAQGGEPETGAGADYLIVGRSITEARDPAGAVRNLNGRR
ncbi:MAG: orotidine 5'-phosphate decarboxylase [Thaumarchaeota archaeon]|nr:orotidine 5'-phosphate decarboxylase [Nitrososphaerota archaeon]